VTTAGLRPPTPEGALIRRERRRTVPRLSIRAAAAKIGISPEHWGDIERGQSRQRTSQFHPSADLLAQMAAIFPQITPDMLREEGQRPDAAAELEGFRARPPASAAPPPPEGASRSLFLGLRIGSDLSEAYDSAMRDLTGRVRLASDQHPGEELKGEWLFPRSAHHAGLWDALVQVGYERRPGEGWPTEGITEAMAIRLALADERHRAGDGNPAGAGGVVHLDLACGGLRARQCLCHAKSATTAPLASRGTLRS
jgi:hypothetical protein